MRARCILLVAVMTLVLTSCADFKQGWEEGKARARAQRAEALAAEASKEGPLPARRAEDLRRGHRCAECASQAPA